ncbi:hypothetical protein [Zobellella sp. An-6]|uniref:hypothetical protein n=1 Tax=Zobellella sp. An-6 TaxID=3400218 RepID=UPI00404371FB
MDSLEDAYFSGKDRSLHDPEQILGNLGQGSRDLHGVVTVYRPKMQNARKGRALLTS